MHKPRLNPLHTQSRGFTLIEVMFASAVFAVILASLYSVFYAAYRLREDAYQTFEAKMPKDYAVEIIKKDLINAVSTNGILGGPLISQKQESGSVRFDSLEFYTATGKVQDNHPWGNVQKVNYSLDQPVRGQEAQGNVLLRTINRNLLPYAEEEPESVPLLTGVETLEFSFYDGQTWQDTWDSTAQENKLPTAIRVYIAFRPPENNEALSLPIELVVPIVTKVNSTSTSTQSGTGASPTPNPQTNPGTGGGNQRPPSTNPQPGQGGNSSRNPGGTRSRS